MKNRKPNLNDVEFLRPLTERPDLEPDAQFVNDLRRRLRSEATRPRKSGRLAGLSIAAITIFTALASLFLLLNVAEEKPVELAKGEPEETAPVSTPAELGPPIEIEANEYIVPLFSVNYGTDEGELGMPQQLKGGSDLTPTSFFVKDGLFYILDNSGKKVVVTDGTNHLFTIQFSDESWLKDIFVDDEGNIYVLDSVERAVMKYNEDGKLLDTVLMNGLMSYIPTGVFVNEEQEIYVRSNDLMINLSKNDIFPYSIQFGDTIAGVERVSETAGRLIINETDKETIIDIPFEDTYGALEVYGVNSKQIIYEKLEVKDESKISTYSHIYVSDREGNFLGAVRIPTERSTYYAEHRIRMENNEIFFMSPEDDGVHFYQLIPGAEERVGNEPEQEDQSDDPVVENDPPVENEATKPYLTEDFLNQLRNGNMPGAEVSIGSSLTDLKKQLGEPNTIGELEGGYLHDYGTYQYIQPALEDLITGVFMVILEDGSTGEDFIKAWGTPTSEGPLIHPHEAYSMTYQLNENYVVRLESESGRNDPVKFIQLIKISTE